MSDPPLTVEDRLGDSVTFLWNCEEVQATRRSDPRVDAIYSHDSDETFLVGIEQHETVNLSGTATGNRIAADAEYPSDPLDALAEWGARLLAHVNGEQGLGWTLSNSYTGRSLGGVIESVDLVRDRGAKYEVAWSVAFRLGRGVMPHDPLDPPTVTPTTPATLDGMNLHEIEQLMTSKSQSLEPYSYAFHDPEDNGIKAQSGAERTITLRGAVPGDETDRQDFDDAVRDMIGVNETFTFDSPYPGQDLDVMVVSFDASREAGITQLGSYNIELVEGITGV